MAEVSSNYTRDIDKLLIFGYIRKLSNSNDLIPMDESIMNILYIFYTKVSKMKNCFFVYGTLRDDNFQGITNWSENADSYHLAIIYGFKMYGVYGFPAAKKTNNNKDWMIGRVIHFEDDKVFQGKLEDADDIEGYNDDKDPEMCLYIRENVECYIFDELTGDKLLEMGYYQRRKIIDFSNESKMKQNVFIYWMKDGHDEQETPHNDWTKRSCRN